MLREFRDRAGIEWRVWDVYPSTRGFTTSTAGGSGGGRFRGAELAEGWLCFESPTERRRLAPIPTGWEIAEPDVLRRYLGQSGYASRRTSGEERTQP